MQPRNILRKLTLMIQLHSHWIPKQLAKPKGKHLHVSDGSANWLMPKLDHRLRVIGQGIILYASCCLSILQKQSSRWTSTTTPLAISVIGSRNSNGWSVISRKSQVRKLEQDSHWLMTILKSNIMKSWSRRSMVEISQADRLIKFFCSWQLSIFLRIGCIVTSKVVGSWWMHMFA